MTSRYEPGTVAIATVRGVPNVRVFRRYSPESGLFDWAYNPDPKRGLDYSCDADVSDVVTDIRPLIVLDWHPSPTHLVELLQILRDNYWTSLADQIESQVKPSRIPEPGLWGVVEAAYEGTRRKLVRMVTGVSDEQWCDDEGTWFDWAELVDPALIRPGIEDAS